MRRGLRGNAGHLGDMEVVSNFKALRNCHHGFVRYGYFECYQECPKGFGENAISCSKPKSYYLELYGDRVKCLNRESICGSFDGKVYLSECR